MEKKRVSIDIDQEMAGIMCAVFINELANEYYRLQYSIDKSLENFERLYGYLPKTDDFNIEKIVKKELPKVGKKISDKLSEVIEEYYKDKRKNETDMMIARHIVLKALLKIIRTLLNVEATFLTEKLFEDVKEVLGGVEE